MAHDNYMMLISLDLDGMLSEREREDLRQHTQTCLACANAWERMRLTDAMLKVQPEVMPAIDFRSKVMGRVKTYDTQRKWRPWLITILSGLTVAMVFSTVLPFVVVAFELYKPLLTWPVIGSVLTWVARATTTVIALGGMALHDLLRWLTYVTTDPAALAIVVGGLVVAATWIGLLEVTKSEPLTEMSQQQA
jgi:anti-sigma factor RsiW